MKTRLEEKFRFTVLIAGIMSLMVTPASAQLLIAFNNFYAAVPGTIECEQFDHGGQGYAYSVLTNVNLGEKYRTSYQGATEGVSIQENSRVNGGLGYCIGNTWATEWFSHLTTISETAVYRIEVRARTAPNAQYNTTFHLNWNGTANVSGTMTVPNDGAWHTVSGTTPAALTATTAPLPLASENGDPNVGWEPNHELLDRSC